MGAVTDSQQPVDFEQEHPQASATAGKWRYRVLFSKLGPLRYVSNLDLARLWERISRRAKLPLAYSQGFNPRPKIQLAAGLPLGYLSTFEIVDLWLVNPIDSMSDMLTELNRMSPEGITVIRIAEAEVSQPALQSITDHAGYQVRIQEICPEDLPERIASFNNLTSCIRSRREKQYDLRLLVDNLRQQQSEPEHIEMTLALSQKRGTARVDEVMDALELGDLNYEVTRTSIELEAPYTLGI